MHSKLLEEEEEEEQEKAEQQEEVLLKLARLRDESRRGFGIISKGHNNLTLLHVAQKLFLRKTLWCRQSMYDVMDHFNNCHSMKPMCVHVTEITRVKQNAAQYNRILVCCCFYAWFHSKVQMTGTTRGGCLAKEGKENLSRLLPACSGEHSRGKISDWGPSVSH